MLAEECREINAALAASLPLLDLPDEPAKPLGLGNISLDSLDLNALVRVRMQHQTRQAQLSIRTQSKQSAAEPEESTYRQVIKRFHAVLKKQQGRGVEVKAAPPKVGAHLTHLLREA